MLGELIQLLGGANHYLPPWFFPEVTPWCLEPTSAEQSQATRQEQRLGKQNWLENGSWMTTYQNLPVGVPSLNPMVNGKLAPVKRNHWAPEMEGPGRWWFQMFFIFAPDYCGNDPIWLAYFSDGLKPPTRWRCIYLLNILQAAMLVYQRVPEKKAVGWLTSLCWRGLNMVGRGTSYKENTMCWFALCPITCAVHFYRA